MDPAPLLMIALFGVAFWLLVMRPAKAKQAAQREMVNRVVVGDRIMTTAGLFGRVTQVGDDEVGIEVADGVVVFMVRQAIGKVIPTPEGPEAANEIAVADVTEGGAGSAKAVVDPAPSSDS